MAKENNGEGKGNWISRFARWASLRPSAERRRAARFFGWPD